MFLWYSMSTFLANEEAVPEDSAMTEWSITSSTGTSGLTRVGSPPMDTSASRMAARSTTAGTPVKSCMRTRSGVKAISVDVDPPDAWRDAHPATASMSGAWTCRPSSWRSRFSRTIFIE
jgi:hypothetical protein